MGQTVHNSRFGRKIGVFFAVLAVTAALGVVGVGPAAAAGIASTARATVYAPSGDLVAALLPVLSNTDDAAVLAKAPSVALSFTGVQLTSSAWLWPIALVVGGAVLLGIGLTRRRRETRDGGND